MATAIAMDYSFLLILCIASVVPQAFANCGPCTSPPKSGPIIVPPVIGKPPITIPPVIGKPPITIPPVIGKPPITIPPVIGKPPITIPPVIGKPPITIPKPPITIPPVVIKPPPVTIPPVIGKPPIALPPLPPLVKPLPPVTGTPAPPSTKPKPKPKPGCPPPPGKKPTCPIDTVKFGACLDVLGVVGGHVGDPAVKCCPLIKGLASAEAALCLCTTIKLKLLGVKTFLPIATQLFITCGKALPPGYTCA